MNALRDRLAHFLRRMGNRVCPDESHEIELHGPDGELMSILFSGGFSASHPPESSGLRLFCRHEDGELVEL